MAAENEDQGILARATPRPWVIEERYLSEVQNAEGKTIASCWHEHAEGREIVLTGVLECSLEESAANAALIVKAVNAYGRSGEDLYEDWKAKALAEVPDGLGATTLPEALTMLETWGPDLFPAAPDGRVHFGRALLDAAIDSIRQHLAQAAEKAEVR